MISSGQKNAGESDDLHFQVWPTLACFFSLHADSSDEKNPVENLKIESSRATRWKDMGSGITVHNAAHITPTINREMNAKYTLTDLSPCGSGDVCYHLLGWLIQIIISLTQNLEQL